MKVTEQLKQWLVSNKRAAADAGDDEYKKAAIAALADDAITAEELAKLTAGEKATGITALLEKLDGRLDALEKAHKPGDPKPRATASDLEKLFATSGGEGAQLDGKHLGADVRVKTVAEQYDGAKSRALYPRATKNGRSHPFAGMPIEEDGRAIDHPSELDKAVSGAFFKWMLLANCRGAERYVRLTDHDKQLVEYALHEMKWGGVIGSGEAGGDEAAGSIPVKNRRLREHEIKAVLDDATSGGLEIAPIVFDDDIILTPLLHGELFPLVTLKTITRGRRVEGGSIGNVTMTSGGADDSPIALFNTANFIAAFDVNIHVVNGAIELGLDFLSDSPVAVAEIITAQYGEVLLAWLDEQIASGDGSTEPEGIFVASGTNSVTMGSDTPTVGDYENLLFGVPKQYKKNTESGRLVFVGNETSYARARGVAVSGTDQRRVFGMTHEDYMLLGHPYKIEDGLANTRVGFFNAKWYRMYRRAGLTVRTSTEGSDLMRNNLMLLVARARFGGALSDGNAAAISTDALA